MPGSVFVSKSELFAIIASPRSKPVGEPRSESKNIKLNSQHPPTTGAFWRLFNTKKPATSTPQPEGAGGCSYGCVKWDATGIHGHPIKLMAGVHRLDTAAIQRSKVAVQPRDIRDLRPEKNRQEMSLKENDEEKDLKKALPTSFLHHFCQWDDFFFFSKTFHWAKNALED